MGIAAEVRGVDDLDRAMEGVIQRMKNMDPATKAAAAELDRAIKKGFSDEESPFAEGWKPLSKYTIDMRRNGSSKPLQDTGLLKLQTTARAEGVDVVFGVTGAASIYGREHLFGNPAEHIPQRRFLPVEDSGAPAFHSGWAQRWFQRFENRVANWVLYGKRSAAGAE